MATTLADAKAVALLGLNDALQAKMVQGYAALMKDYIEGADNTATMERFRVAVRGHMLAYMEIHDAIDAVT